MAGITNFLTQIVRVTGYAVRTIPQRKGASAAAVFGIAGVVAVMVGVLSIAQGIFRTMSNSVSDINAVVMRTGADTEMMSGLTGEETRVIVQAPGIAVGPDGPVASTELFVIIDLPRRSTQTSANVPLRGVVPAAFAIRDRLRIVEGRSFEWGKNEVVVGLGASREFSGLELGDRIPVGQREWPIVGIFEADGGIAESEIWADAAVVQDAYRRGNTYQSVYARLQSPESFATFKDSLTTDPRVPAKVLRESEYYVGQSTLMINIVTGLGTLISALMGLGAMFGALNTMYTAVAARTREIATLRALGFRAGPVVISVLAEALLLATLGGLIGGAVAWLACDELTTATINWSTFSQMTFAFDVTPALLTQGIAYAVLIGLVGGLLPAIRAARMPIATALREL